MARGKRYAVETPMRVQARPGSRAERLYYETSALPSGAWPNPKAIARGIDPSPLDDLLYHGGKVVPHMEFQNIYLGSAADWRESDVDAIESAITRAMRDKRLNNVMLQYFPGAMLTCDPRAPLLLSDAKPVRLDEPAVQAELVALYDAGSIKKSSLGTTLFNLVLPAGTVLTLDRSSSLSGLGGYHGSVHITRNRKRITLYYSANVYSQTLPSGQENGIVAFDRPWKNVVGTLYHELNEFRTDPDVGDAIAKRDDDFLGWTSRRGHECGDQPLFAATSLHDVFKQVSAGTPRKRTPIQYMFSNAVHGAEGPIATPHT